MRRFSFLGFITVTLFGIGALLTSCGDDDGIDDIRPGRIVNVEMAYDYMPADLDLAAMIDRVALTAEVEIATVEPLPSVMAVSRAPLLAPEYQEALLTNGQNFNPLDRRRT